MSFSRAGCDERALLPQLLGTGLGSHKVAHAQYCNAPSSSPYVTNVPLRSAFTSRHLALLRQLEMTKIKTRTRKTVATLGQNDCRWPIGDPRQEDFHFCGAAKLPGRPYCETHWRQAFQATKTPEPVRTIVGAVKRAA